LSVKTFISNLSLNKRNGNHLKIDHSAASNTGYCSAASNTGDYSAATNTGDHSAATNTGDHSAATNTGYCSAASNTGYCSAATNTGNYSAASNTGYCSAAITTGTESKSSVFEKDSIAISAGKGGLAKGGIGSWIVLAERGDNYSIEFVKTAKVDGIKIKKDTWYLLKNGKFVKAKDDDKQ
jgi:hypothetical protein